MEGLEQDDSGSTPVKKYRERVNSEKRFREKKREEKGGNHGRGWLDVLTGELQKGRAWSTGARGRDAGGGAWCSDFRGSRERDLAEQWLSRQAREVRDLAARRGNGNTAGTRRERRGNGGSDGEALRWSRGEVLARASKAAGRLETSDPRPGPEELDPGDDGASAGGHGISHSFPVKRQRG